jgi:hypothetical protein
MLGQLVEHITVRLENIQSKLSGDQGVDGKIILK